MTERSLTSTPSEEGRVTSGPRPTGSARGANAALWVLQGLIAVFFVFGAVSKLLAHPPAVASFEQIGYGAWFMYLVGALELAGAVALLIPLLSGVAALAFIGLMIGAFTYNMTVFDGENALIPVLFLPFLALVAWGRRDRTGRLLAVVTRRG